MRAVRLLLAVCALAPAPAQAEAAQPAPSVCRGTPADGSLENGWKLPRRGPNFAAYSDLGSLLGRTYVHSTVHAIALEAYAALESAAPGVGFVYGETGFQEGGEFEPHKTHRNGLSVDFMVPVRDARGDPARLPTHALNRWGYDLEFDAEGRLDDLRIDFEAVAEHVYQLDVAARRHGAGLQRVIFAPELQPLLQQTRRGAYLQQKVRFSERRAWVRHDEHYHVDFAVPCAETAAD